MNHSNRKLLFQLMNKVLVICFFIISLTMVLLLWFFKEFLIKLNCGFSLDYVTTILDSFCTDTKTKSDKGTVISARFL